MASPFEIFRRNQWLVVALFGLSIFAFVLLDPLTTGGDSGLFPVVLGVLLGGVAAWLISNTTGRAAVIWAACGAVAGGLFVGLAGNFYGSGDAIAIRGGSLTRTELIELDRRRNTANRFFGSLRGELIEQNPENDELPREIPPTFDYSGTRLAPTMFGLQPVDNLLGRNATREQGLIFGELLNREADEIGLAVSDQRVNALINEHYGVAPSRDTVRKIRGRMRVGETELFEAIKAELRAREMLSLLLPNPVPLPTDAWELYRRLNQSANVAYVELPVESFVPLAGEPTEGEVTALFEEYKAEAPDQFTGLGFRRPPQIKLEVLRAKRSEAEKSVTPPTDAEVRAFYEANRESFRNPAYDDYLVEQRAAEGAAELDAADPAATGPALPTLPSGDGPDDAADDDAAAPADPAPAPVEPAPATTEPAMTEPEPAPTEPAEPTTPEPAGPTEPEGDEPKTALPAPLEPGPDGGEEPGGEPAGEEEDGDTAFAGAFRGAGLAMVQDDPAPAADPQDDPPARKPVTAPKPVAKASSEPKKPAEEPKPEEPKPADPPADDPGDTTPETDPEMKAEPPADAPPAGDGEPGDGEMADDALAADALEADEPAMTAPAAPEPPAADEPAVGDEAPPEPTPGPAAGVPAARRRAHGVAAGRTAAGEGDRGAGAPHDRSGGLHVHARQRGLGERPRPPRPGHDADRGGDRGPPRRRPRRDGGAAQGVRRGERVRVLRDPVPRPGGPRQRGVPGHPGRGPRGEPDGPAGTGDRSVLRQPRRPAVPGRPHRRGPGHRRPLRRLEDRPAVQRGAGTDRRGRPRRRRDGVQAAEGRRTGRGPRRGPRREGVRERRLPAEGRRGGDRHRQDRTADPLEVSETGPFTRLRLERPTGQLAFFQPPTPRPNPVPTIGSASPEFLEAAFDTLTPGAATAVPAFDPDRSFTVELLAREPSDAALSEMYESFLKDAATNPGLYNSAGDEVAGAARRAFVEGLFEKYGVDPASLSGILER